MDIGINAWSRSFLNLQNTLIFIGYPARLILELKEPTVNIEIKGSELGQSNTKIPRALRGQNFYVVVVNLRI